MAHKVPSKKEWVASAVEDNGMFRPVLMDMLNGQRSVCKTFSCGTYDDAVKCAKLNNTRTNRTGGICNMQHSWIMC